MPENSLQVPENLSFPDAIALTQTLIDRFPDLADTEIESTVTHLVNTENGARGFFVTYLSDDTVPGALRDRSLADHPSEAIVTALRSSPDIVSELLVKNLAMSTAMAVYHRRNQDADAAEGSDRVQRRSLHLIRLLHLPQMRDLAQKLHESAATGQGEFKTFLDRWGYDAEQRQAIEQAVSQVV